MSLASLSCLLLSVFSPPPSPRPPQPLSVSFTHPVLSLSVSLFCDCSGWSPCGTPCRVPNLFIISALCPDARGMLKYTPPRSGYKWAGVPPSFLPALTAQPTRPLGWTHLTSQKPRRSLLKLQRLRWKGKPHAARQQPRIKALFVSNKVLSFSQVCDT